MVKEDLIKLSEVVEAIDNIDWYRQDANKDMVLGAANTHEAWYRAEDVYKALESVPSAQSKPRWIPVSERLPKPRIDVWVNSDIGQMQGYYEEHVGVWYASFGQGRDYLELIVNAWMPLPEPYREERTKE